MRTIPDAGAPRLRSLLIGLCACVSMCCLAACGTNPAVYSDYDTAVKFDGYRSFAILPLQASGSALDPEAASRLAQPIERTVREVLTARGMHEVAREQADFVVTVRGQSLPKVEVTDYGYTGYPYPYWAGASGWTHHAGYGAYAGYGGMDNTVSVRDTKERKLTVEIYDNASRKEAWVGWMEHTGDSVDAETVLAAVRAILEGFPPGAEAR